MGRKILFLGSIGVMAETSEIQREAYNEALAEAGLNWNWDVETYRELLQSAGGMDRLRLLSDATGAALSDRQIKQIHARKTEIACARIVDVGVQLRPGIGEIIEACLQRETPIGLVTSTYPPNIRALQNGAGGKLPLERFAVIVSREDIAFGKPHPAAYTYALETTGFGPDEAIAVEDTALSALSARQAGVDVCVTPGDYTNKQELLGYERMREAVIHDTTSVFEKIASKLF